MSDNLNQDKGESKFDKVLQNTQPELDIPFSSNNPQPEKPLASDLLQSDQKRKEKVESRKNDDLNINQTMQNLKGTQQDLA